MDNGQVTLVRRDTLEKIAVKLNDVHKEVVATLKAIHENLYTKSKKSFIDSVVRTTSYDELKTAIENKKIVLAPFCNEPECEDLIKTEIPGTTTRNIPFDESLPKGSKCIHCGKEAKCMIYFARSY